MGHLDLGILASVPLSAAPTAWRFAQRRLHEGRQGKGVAAVLQSEDAEEEAVHDPHDETPDQHSDLLSFGIGHARHLDGKGYGRKGENTV